MVKANSSNAHMRIAIVDDDPSFLSMLHELLTDEGYVTHCFSDGLQVQRAIYHAPFEIIISDINMPDLSGIELLRYLREIGSKAEVILMTADAQLETAMEAVRLGAFDYLQKPFDHIEDIVALINRVAEKILQKKRQNYFVQAVIDKTKQLVSYRGEGNIPEDLQGLLKRTEELVLDLQKTNHQGPGTRKLSGAIQEIGLANLLQMLSMSGKSGKLFIQSSQSPGEIWLKRGRMIHAQCHRVRGKNALFRLFRQEEGEFQFYLTDTIPDEGDLQKSVDVLILDCLRQMDEYTKLGPRVPPRDLSIRVKIPIPEGLTGDDQMTLGLLLRYVRVGDVLDHSPLMDLATIRSLIRLRLAGYLDIYFSSPVFENVGKQVVEKGVEMMQIKGKVS